MKSLVLVLLLFTLPSLLDAACMITPQAFGATHCQDYADKTWHAMGSSWRNSECMDCTCEGCCSATTIPRRFPDDCVSVFDSKACVYTVHKKDDPTVLCPYAAVGK